jgi:tetratricopeptide (TPR) repeat protein
MLDSRLERALTALRLHRYDVAREEAMTFLAAEPDNARGHLVLGEVFLRTGRYEAGRIQAADMLRLEPDFAWGHWLLAWCWLLDRQNDRDEGTRNQRLFRAQRSAEQALALDPSQPSFFEIAAAAAMEGGNFDSALHLIARGLALDPACPYLTRMRGHVLKAANNTWDAARAFEASLSLGPEDPVSHRELAQLRFEAGLYREARDHIEEAMRLDPADPIARALLLKIVQTQHWLLRFAIWLHKSTKWIRLLFPIWIFATVCFGLPVVVWADDVNRSRWLAAAAIAAWLAVVLFPLETLVLPQLTNLLWVLIGRDAGRRSLTRQESWDRILPGMMLLSAAPVIVLSFYLHSAVLFSSYMVFNTSCILQSGVAAFTSPRRRWLGYGATMAYAIVMASWVLAEVVRGQEFEYPAIVGCVISFLFAFGFRYGTNVPITR